MKEKRISFSRGRIVTANLGTLRLACQVASGVACNGRGIGLKSLFRITRCTVESQLLKSSQKVNENRKARGKAILNKKAPSKEAAKSHE